VGASGIDGIIDDSWGNVQKLFLLCNLALFQVVPQAVPPARDKVSGDANTIGILLHFLLDFSTIDSFLIL
jgi:hypothetical protein